MRSGRIHISDFLIINIPVLLFLLLVPAGLVVLIHSAGKIRIVSVPLIVWGLSGAVLLILDYYYRKKELFLRILTLFEVQQSKGLALYLKSTLCGLSILWAVRARKKNYRRFFYERKIQV